MPAAITPSMKSGRSNFTDSLRRDLVMRYDLEIGAESLSGRDLHNLGATKIHAVGTLLAKKCGESLAGENEITTVKQICEAAGLHEMEATVAKPHTSIVAAARHNALWHVRLRTVAHSA